MYEDNHDPNFKLILKSLYILIRQQKTLVGLCLCFGANLIVPWLYGYKLKGTSFKVFFVNELPIITSLL